MPNPLHPEAGIVLENPAGVYGLPVQDTPNLYSDTLGLTPDWNVSINNPPASFAVRYAAPWGSESNDGLSWGTPLLYAGSAYDACPTKGKVRYASGTQWDAGAYGIWLDGRGGSLDPGFRACKSITIEGMGENDPGEDCHFGKSLLNTNGAPVGIHLIQGRNVTIRNYQNSSFPTNDLFLEEGGGGSFHLAFDNCYFRTNGGAGKAVNVDGNDNLFWLYFINCGVRGKISPGSVDNVAFLIDKAFEWYWLGGTMAGGRMLVQGCVTVGGSNNGYIQGVTVQGDLTVTNTLSPFTITGGNGGAFYVDAAVYDWTGGAPNVSVLAPCGLTVSTGPNVTARGRVLTLNQHSDVATASGGPNPNAHGQIGFHVGRVYGQIDRFDQRFDPVMVTNQNLATLDPTTWAARTYGGYPTGGAATVALTTAPNGLANKAARLTYGGAGEGSRESAKVSRVWAVGDIVSATCWHRITTGTTNASMAVGFDGGGGGSVTTTTDLTGLTADTAIRIPSSLAASVAGRWVFARIVLRVTATNGVSTPVVVSHRFPTGDTLDVYLPTLCVYPVTDVDGVERAVAQGVHHTDAAAVGKFATLPGQIPYFPDGAVISQFVPASLSPSLWLSGDSTFWQDSARTTLAVADGDPVGSWDDISGANHHAQQATAGNQPVLKIGSNGLNGYPVIRTDGTDDYLRATIDAQAAQTIFVVTKKLSAFAAGTHTALGLAANSQLYTDSASSATWYNYKTNQAAGSSFATLSGSGLVWSIVAITYTSTSVLTIRHGGGAGRVIDPSDGYAAAVVLDLGGIGATTNSDHDFAEVFRVSSALTLAQHDLVGNYLANKYGLTWTTAI